MPNSRYRKGYAFERRVMREWQDAGYECIRAAGSHGPADVWAANAVYLAPGNFHPTPLVFIQCKSGSAKASKTELEALRESAWTAGATPLLATTPKRGVILYQEVTRDGLIPFEGP